MDQAIARAAPEVSVTVSPRLRSLRACGNAGAVAGAASGIDHAAAPPPRWAAAGDGNEAPDTAPATQPQPDATSAFFPHHGREIALRRDGRRPLRFTGLPLLRCQTLTRLDGSGGEASAPQDADAPEAIQRLDIYMESAGSLVVATSVEFRGPVAARPRYRAARVSAPGDLAAFAAGHAAEQGFLGPGPGQAAPQDAGAAARRLSDAFHAMLRESGLSLPGLLGGAGGGTGA